jgi:hypothetical protein
MAYAGAECPQPDSSDPVYVRGEAYLAAGQGGAAATEFQKILDHSGIVWNCWTERWRIWAWPVQTPCR